MTVIPKRSAAPAADATGAAYQSGFGNTFATEALAGALPCRRHADRLRRVPWHGAPGAPVDLNQDNDHSNATCARGAASAAPSKTVVGYAIGRISTNPVAT